MASVTSMPQLNDVTVRYHLELAYATLILLFFYRYLILSYLIVIDPSYECLLCPHHLEL